MAAEVNSLSSALMFNVTQYRNQFGGMNKAIAQAGYALTVLVSVVESATALFFSALSILIYPCSSAAFDRATEWLSSSVFCIGWSLADFFLNFCVTPLVANEAAARQILQSGNLMMLPAGSVI
jgi:hypothetical protein